MQSNLVEGASLENDLRRSNGYFVELAMEAICMANNSRELLSQAGFSIEHFIDKVLLGLGGELSNSERIHGPVSLLDPSGFGLSNQDIMLVAVSLLRALGRCNYTGAGAYNDESEIELLEARLRALLESPSWRLTKVLRDLNSGLSRSSQPSVIPSTIAELSPSFSPRAYALLLRTIIRQVKTSRSWRITAPLRSWDGERERWKRTLGKKQNV